jgi:BirA family biotin operon repressor/biotin-[acetyl-CoA-carboxylase] ligase
MDAAHDAAAAGAPNGTLVLAQRQTSGRGRSGKTWLSADESILLSYIVRSPDRDAAQVLSLRTGLAVRNALQQFTQNVLLLKWPNDVCCSAGKVAGILIESRWREASPEWSVIGIGINISIPRDLPEAAGLEGAGGAVEVLCRVVPALGGAATPRGLLTREEVREYSRHDMLRGRKICKPVAGIVVGISGEGELVVSTESGTETARSGSVILEARQ